MPPPPSWSVVPRSTVRTSRCGRTRTAAHPRSAPPIGVAPSSCGRWLRCSSSRSNRGDEGTRRGRAGGPRDDLADDDNANPFPRRYRCSVLRFSCWRRPATSIPPQSADWSAIKTCSWSPGGCRPGLGCVQHLKREWKGTFDYDGGRYKLLPELFCNLAYTRECMCYRVLIREFNSFRNQVD